MSGGNIGASIHIGSIDAGNLLTSTLHGEPPVVGKVSQPTSLPVLFPKGRGRGEGFAVQRAPGSLIPSPNSNKDSDAYCCLPHPGPLPPPRNERERTRKSSNSVFRGLSSGKWAIRKTVMDRQDFLTNQHWASISLRPFSVEGQKA